MSIFDKNNELILQLSHSQDLENIEINYENYIDIIFSTQNILLKWNHVSIVLRQFLNSLFTVDVYVNEIVSSNSFSKDLLKIEDNLNLLFCSNNVLSSFCKT